MLTRKSTTPTIHVLARPSRQPAPQYWPQRCSTMKMKNICTDQKWMLLKKWPRSEVCHQAAPMKARTVPLTSTQTRAAMVTTPKTYTHEPTKAGWRVGSTSSRGRRPSRRLRTAAVHPVSRTAGEPVEGLPEEPAAGGGAPGPDPMPPASLIVVVSVLGGVVREGGYERDHEEQHHRCDQSQVGQRDEDESPVQVWRRAVHWVLRKVSGGTGQRGPPRDRPSDLTSYGPPITLSCDLSRQIGWGLWPWPPPGWRRTMVRGDCEIGTEIGHRDRHVDSGGPALPPARPAHAAGGRHLHRPDCDRGLPRVPRRSAPHLRGFPGGADPPHLGKRSALPGR